MLAWIKRNAISVFVALLLWLSLLMLCTSPRSAHATNFIVTNNTTMGIANAAATAGDIYTIADGTYSTAPAPAGNGTLVAPVKIIGNVAAPGNVIISGTTTLTKDFLRFYGMRWTAGFDVGPLSQGDSLVSCVFASNVDIHGDDVVFKTSWQTGGRHTAFADFSTYPSSVLSTCGTFVRNKFVKNLTYEDWNYSATVSSGTSNVVEFLGAKFVNMNRCVWRVEGGSALTDGQLFNLYWTQDWNATDCSFTLINNTASGNTKFGWNMRDSTCQVDAVRCTLSTRAATGRAFDNLFSNSGGQCFRVANNNWTECVFRAANIASTYGAGFYFQEGVNGQSFFRCTFIDSVRQCLDTDDVTALGFNVRHCTFWAGGKRCFRMNDNTAPGPSNIISNIFYAVAATVAASSFDHPVSLRDSATGPTVCDSNLYFFRTATPADSQYAIRGPGGTFGAPKNYDHRSVFRSPRFSDSTFATFSGLLGANSFANDSWWKDGFVGALGAASADVTAPSAVSTLAVTGTNDGAVTLTWTAPGDDAAVGTATTYDLRYSTAAITSGNFGAATLATGLPTPHAAGSAETMTVTGLTNGTPYFFAIKSSDEVPNASAVSNFPGAATPAATDITPPSAVSDLRVVAIGNTSATLYWTSPGDDGMAGIATVSDLRYSTATITNGNFGAATQVSTEPTIFGPGLEQRLTISGLTNGTTYYFALKTSDEIPNASDLSNIATATPAADSERHSILHFLIHGRH